jgi:hypothetical protein
LANNKTTDLNLDKYKTIGGLISTPDKPNALSSHADEIYGKLIMNEQKQIAEILFRSLTERGDAQRDTRRPTPLADIIELTGATFDEVVTVINVFRQPDCCFLMPPIRVDLTADSIIDISHESLIRQWQRLKDWTADEAESAKTYQRLEDRANEWNISKAGLLQSPDLEIYQKWWQDKQPTELWAARYGLDKGMYFKLANSFLSESKKKADQERKKQKRNNRILMATVFGLIIFGICIHYAYFGASITYCNATAKRFGALKCIGKIPKNEIKNRSVTYQFTSQGAFNPAYMVKAINSKGECTDKHSVNAYLDTKKRQQTTDKSNDKTSNDKTSNDKKSKECLWKYVFDEEKHIVYEKAYDKNDTLVWGLVYSPHTKSNEKQAFYVGDDGYPQPSINTQAEYISFNYSKDGDEITTNYFNRNHKEQLKDGYHQVDKKFDEKGNLIELDRLDLYKKSILIDYKPTAKYDDKGNQIELAFFNLQGQPTVDNISNRLVASE